jgi:dihydrodipicolinate synthase/N-acetylneuraminate lyase
MTRFAGIYPILQTPFDDRGAIDVESLKREVAFCLRAGAHGLVIPANASEFFTLSDAERLQVTEVALSEARGKVPIVISCSGVSTQAAVAFVHHAVAHGADGIMVLPPYVRRQGEAGVLIYYEAVADAAEGRSVIVQNAEPPLGTPLSIPALLKLLDRVPGIRYVKEEVTPSGQRMSALLQATGERLDGAFGGQNGIWMLNELDRGSCGNMPNCATVDAHVQIYNLYTAGRRDEAEALYLTLLPLLTLGSQYGVAFAKDVLHRRGVIRTKVIRDPQPAPLDKWDLADVDRYLDRLRPVLIGAT